MQYSDSDLEQLRRCKDDFAYFCKFVKIINKGGALVKFRLNASQQMLHEALKKNRWQIVLKARQTGTSTFVAAYYLHKALFNRNHRVAIAAHTLEAVRQIFNIYQTIYDNLPAQLRLECTNENANELRFRHGSRIKVGTPNGFRGSTYQSIHASEAAFWKSPDEDIAALLQTAGENPTIIFESTPNGLNHYHNLWTTESGYDKTFISWLIEPSYNQTEEPAPPPSDSEKEFLHSLPPLTKRQKNWAIHTLRTKCANSTATFRQEYAGDPVSCFISSGERVFDLAYPGAKVAPGLIEYEDPNAMQPYLMGVDAAEGGPQGDYSAFVVMTRAKPPKIVATYYQKEPVQDFACQVLATATKYNAMVNVEAASTVYAVIEHLKRFGHPHLYRRMIKDKTSSELTEKLGFNTNTKTRALLMASLHELLLGQKITVTDQRLQHELNTFVYVNGKPRHDTGCHDDMIFALALAYVAYEQADYIYQATKLKKPLSVAEVIKWEAVHGKRYNPSKNDGYTFESVLSMIG